MRLILLVLLSPVCVSAMILLLLKPLPAVWGSLCRPTPQSTNMRGLAWRLFTWLLLKVGPGPVFVGFCAMVSPLLLVLLLSVLAAACSAVAAYTRRL
jgi:hypothetical protein